MTDPTPTDTDAIREPYRETIRRLSHERDVLVAEVSRLRDQLAVANEDYRQLAQKEFDEGERRAELEGVVARITEPATLRQITSPIERDRHALPCSMRKAIYDGARCDCNLEERIAKDVIAELRAVLAVPTTRQGDA